MDIDNEMRREVWRTVCGLQPGRGRRSTSPLGGWVSGPSLVTVILNTTPSTISRPSPQVRLSLHTISTFIFMTLFQNCGKLAREEVNYL